MQKSQTCSGVFNTHFGFKTSVKLLHMWATELPPLARTKCTHEKQIYCSSPQPNSNLALSSRVGYHILTPNAELEKVRAGIPMKIAQNENFTALRPAACTAQPGWYWECKSHNSIISASLHPHHEVEMMQIFFPSLTEGAGRRVRAALWRKEQTTAN